MGRGSSDLAGLPLDEPVFSDVQFQSADEKQKVYKAWLRFLDSNFDRAKFTKALYHHLMQHCGFIAHFDIHGFYAAQFGDARLRAEFIESFLSGGMLESYRAGGPDYTDINEAMAQALQARKGELLYDANRGRIEELRGLRARIDEELRSLGADPNAA